MHTSELAQQIPAILLSLRIKLKNRCSSGVVQAHPTLSDSGKAVPATGHLSSPARLTSPLDVTLFRHLTVLMTLARHLAVTGPRHSSEVYEETAFNAEIDPMIALRDR